MIRYILSVEGMKCGMCESHVNDVVRKTADVKKVSSSHGKNRTEIVAERDIDVDAVVAAIAAQGYHAKLEKKESYEKRGLFSSKK